MEDLKPGRKALWRERMVRTVLYIDHYHSTQKFVAISSGDNVSMDGVSVSTSVCVCGLHALPPGSCVRTVLYLTS